MSEFGGNLIWGEKQCFILHFMRIERACFGFKDRHDVLR